MEWIPRAKTPDASVAPSELKVCELCGTLNHNDNRECFTCGWHGQFGRDTTTIQLAWHRLAHQHEGVLMEHVTARNTPALDDFGRRRPSSRWQQLQSRCRQWYTSLLSGRTRRAAHSRRPDRQPATPQGDS